ILAKTDVIEVRDLSPKRFGLEEREVHIPVGTSIADTEKAITLKTFAFTGGDQKKTAKILGVSEKDLKAKLQTYLGANATKPRSTASKLKGALWPTGTITRPS